VLRVNLARIDRAALHAQLEHEGIATHVGVHSSSALVVDNAPDTRANLFGCHAWREGLFEVQDEGSQLIVDACGAKPGDVVVDLCAGRGGKTLGLADHMHNRGLLYVHDVDERALADQAPRLARAHITCVQRGLPPTGTADVVLVDAPCSSTGTWRRSSDRRFRTHPNDVVGLVPRQRMLRMQGASLVKLGGTLVYATCSLVHDENEGIASEPLPGFTRVHTRVLLPHVDGTDGFFLAVWRRDDDDGSATDRKPARAHP
jgi:16S rRNA (cytosine967-C5)-methyltransferase